MRISVWAALAVFWPGFAAAERLPDLGGLPVEIAGEAGEQRLIVGRRTIIADYMVEVKAIEDVAGVPALVGYAFAGGNACEGSHFVVALIGGAPQLYGPIETCVPTEFQLSADRIVFATQALPTRDGQTWEWTPQAGLVEGAPVAFAAGSGLGWDDLAARAPGHPYDLLYYPEIAAAMDALLGENREVFLERLESLGSGAMRGADFFGTACLKFTCPEDKAMVFLDGGEREVYLAWTVSGQDAPIAAPALDAWPQAALAAYEEWLFN